jgi:hypothetical protein
MAEIGGGGIGGRESVMVDESFQLQLLLGEPR